MKPLPINLLSLAQSIAKENTVLAGKQGTWGSFPATEGSCARSLWPLQAASKAGADRSALHLQDAAIAQSALAGVHTLQDGTQDRQTALGNLYVAAKISPKAVSPKSFQGKSVLWHSFQPIMWPSVSVMLKADRLQRSHIRLYSCCLLHLLVCTARVNQAGCCHCL